MRDARGEADEAILAREMRPRFVDGLRPGALGVQRLELVAQLRLRRRRQRRGGRGAFVAGVGHAIERRLRCAGRRW